MKLTKLEHACLVLEDNDQKLIIDPGVFSISCIDYRNVAAVVVTHVHPDHFDLEKLKNIYKQNPNVRIFTVQTVVDELGEALPVTVVADGQKATCQPFELEFFGTNHALIHESIPLTLNTGVMVNNKVYYPGDALTVPHQPVETLAVPASGPWLKVGEAMDLITAIKPKQVFPTHNAILTDIGGNIHGYLLEMACQSVGAKYIVLEPGEFLTS